MGFLAMLLRNTCIGVGLREVVMLSAAKHPPTALNQAQGGFLAMLGMTVCGKHLFLCHANPDVQGLSCSE